MWNFLIDISQKSFYLIPLMALLLVVTIAVIIERMYFFHRVLNAGESMEHDIHLVKSKNKSDLIQVAKHYEGTVQVGIVQTALACHHEDAETMERQIDETIMWQLPKMDRNLWLIDTAVTLGPLLGLLGTIFGMIESFSLLGAGSAGHPAAVTGGIAHALIATTLGLTIAIIADSFLNYFHKRLRLALHQMDLVKVMLINRFHVSGVVQHDQPAETEHSISLPESKLAGAR